MELVVQKREKFGKASKALRREGLIPAELYGHGIENAHLSVNAKDFEKIFREAGESTVINIVLDGKKRPVLVHDVDRNYLSGAVHHIDFYEVRMDEKIRTHIPLEFRGEAPAVKEQGGFLNKTVAEIEVEALPGDLPHNLIVDLTPLNELNKSLFMKDIPVPHGVKILLDPETVVVSVMPPVKEEEVVEAPVDVSQVKVETEEKKAERAAQETAEEK